MKKTIHWDEIGYTAVIDIENENRMEFEVYKITANGEDANGNFTVRNYKRQGAKTSDDMTENLSEAQTAFEGYIKWDACSHVTFGDEDGYLHLCGGRSWKNIIEAINRIWKIAEEKLPKDHSRDMFDIDYTPAPLTNSK